jgi:hypothetical protein
MRHVDSFANLREFVGNHVHVTCCRVDHSVLEQMLSRPQLPGELRWMDAHDLNVFVITTLSTFSRPATLNHRCHIMIS